MEEKKHPIYNKEEILGGAIFLEELEKHKTSKSVASTANTVKHNGNREAVCFSSNCRKIQAVFKTIALFLVFSKINIVFFHF